MTDCPQKKNLERLVDGGLPEAERDDVRAHVMGCARCQEVLDHVTDNLLLRSSLKRVQEEPTLPQDATVLRRVLEDLRNTPVDGPVDETFVGNRGREYPFLGPAEQPGELGTLGMYRIQEELGRGGMGIIFRAYDAALERTVAVKVLRPELADATARRRLVSEARFAARLRHDHLVAVYAVIDPPGGLPYLVMEYLAGPTLAQRIRAAGRLDVGAAAGVVIQVAQGTEAAHAAGLVHRDIKPSNIMFDPASGRAKLMDFGLARLDSVATRLTCDGTLAGTPAYMSPEQARGSAQLDARSDIYSLGVTLYEALTGVPPFQGTPHRVLQQILDEEPPAPRRLNEAIPRDLETICQKALAKEPARRYASARALADDLRRWQRGEPIHARPAARWERAWRWCRRNPLPAALSFALVLILLAGLSGTSWQAWRASENAAQAEERRDDAEESQRVAIAAADKLLTQVSEDELLRQPQLQHLRRRLLELALAHYRDFLKTHRDNPRLVRETALAAYRVAAIVDAIGSADDADAAYAEAIARLEQAIAGNGSDRDLQVKRNECHVNRGMMLTRVGRTQAAMASLETAVALTKELPHDQTERRSLQLRLFACYGNLANVHQQKGEVLQARSYYEKIQSELEPMARAEPHNAFIQRMYGLNLHNLAMTGGADPAAALALGERALQVRQRLLAGSPGNALYRRDLARTEGILAIFHQRLGNLSAARQHHQEAVTTLERLVQMNHPSYLEWRGNLAQAYLNLGGFLAGQKEYDQALGAYEKGRVQDHAILKIDPKALTSRAELAENLRQSAEVHLRRNEPARALPLLKEAVALEKQMLPSGPDHHTGCAVSCQLHGTALFLLKRPADAIALFEEALTHFRLALEQKPADDDRRQALAEHYRRFAEGLREQGDAARAAELTLERARLLAAPKGQVAK